MISHIWRRARMKGRELSADVKSSSLKPYRMAGGSPGRVPRLNENGLVLPSNKKNWNAFPSQRMPNTDTWNPCCVLFQQQATIYINVWYNSVQAITKGWQTIAFCYHLSNRIHSLSSTTNFGLDFDEKSRDRTKRLEVIFDLTLGSYTAIKDRFRQISEGKSKLSNQAIKDLRMTVWVSS